ncbi:MAG: phosphoenolpyruvate--protein phosphotransferase [Ancrocorticia sp.]|uniref:phosphoenolpyruvate--protein phosphotransferase n=1 Tax=Ancrocorticia sp. TaxID=2593684 RepID=UPI003F91AF2B
MTQENTEGHAVDVVKAPGTDVHGTPVVSGMAYAPAMWVVRPDVPPATAPSIAEDKRDEEFARYQAAAKVVAERLTVRGDATIGHASDVLKMSASLATDRGIAKEVKVRISKQGLPAIQSLVGATDKFVTMFEKAGGLMAERVTDLRDVRDRVVAEIQGQPEPGIPVPTEPVVLLADDLAPADTAGLDPELIVGVATELGGPTSHTAIIARQLGIPCIVAMRELRQVKPGDLVLLDGGKGRITINADPAVAEDKVAKDHEWREKVRAWRGPAQTTDGHHAELLVNVQDGTTAAKAAQGQAEGVGLFRTEFCFLDAKTEPSIEEQTSIYSPVFEAFSHGKVVVRTLDAGSDKPIAYANLDDEENPALGVRGLRITGQNPELLQDQLDAIAKASQGHEGKSWVMAPMVSTLREAEWFTQEVRRRGMTGGIMVEVPAVAVMAEEFLKVVDFVSLGTNDLTQYTMAADRLSPHLAEYTDPWQPAVLKLIAQTAAAGKKLGKPVGVCGEAAADPILACVLLGMGVTSLSMAASAVSTVGAQVSAVSFSQCEAAAAVINDARDAKHARNLATEALGIR